MNPWLKNISIALIASGLLMPIGAAQASPECEAVLVASWLPDLPRLTEPGFLHQRLASAKKDLTTAVQEILEIDQNQRTFTNTVLRLEDARSRYLEEIVYYLAVASTVVPGDGQQDLQKIQVDAFDVLNELALNHELYLAIQDQKPESPAQQALLKEYMEMFRENGATLDQASRKTIQKLQTEMSELQVAYLNNLKKEILVSFREDELKGVDLTTLKPTAEGLYQIAAQSSDSVRKILTSATSEETRKKIFLAYRSRAPKNSEILIDYVNKAGEIAQLLGKDNTLDSLISPESLARNRQEVARVIGELRAHMQPGLTAKREAMQALKAASGSTKPLAPWDIFYFESQLEKKEAATKTNELNGIERHFPAIATMERALHVFARLLSLQVVERKDLVGWTPEVRAFEVRKLDGAPVGLLYLDPHSRLEKDPNTAFVSRLAAPEANRQAPAVAVVFNMGPREEADSKYLEIQKVGTLVHEFGHAFHALLAKADYVSTWGYNRTIDFIEIPSNFGELLLTDPDTLMAIADGGLTRAQAEAVARELSGTPRVSPTHLHNTFFLAWIDQLLFDRASGPSTLTPAQLHRLYRQAHFDFYGIETDPGDRFFDSFSHLVVGYGGNYYSYFWSKMAAIHIWDRMSALGGFHSPVARAKYVSEVLEPTTAVHAQQALENFLGTPMSPVPYLRRLGLAAE